MAHFWLWSGAMEYAASIKPIARFLRSAGIGVVATLIDLVLLASLVEFGGVDPLVANVPALLGGLAVQFIGNKYWAFDDRSRRLLRQGGLFALVEIGAVTLNGGAFHLLVSTTTLPYLVIRLVCSAVVYAAFSYPLWHYVFSPGARHRGPR